MCHDDDLEGVIAAVAQSISITPFRQLCDDGDLEGVRAAIARGEDVNSWEKHNMTGLMWASYRGHNSVVKVLLQQRSLDINSSDNRCNAALHYACDNGNLTGLRMLLGDPRLTSVNARNDGGCV